MKLKCCLCRFEENDLNLNIIKLINKGLKDNEMKVIPLVTEIYQ